MKARRKPLVVKEIRYADDDDASRRKIMEVYSLLLRHQLKMRGKASNKGRRG